MEQLNFTVSTSSFAGDHGPLLLAQLFQQHFHGRNKLAWFLGALKQMPEERTEAFHYLQGLGFPLSWSNFISQHEQLVEVEAKGVRFTYPGHIWYPLQFLTLNEPPYFLSFLGEPLWQSQVGISIVGSREPTALSKTWMDLHLSLAIETLPVFTISGGARGVDQRAHQLSILKNKPTVAILPSGLGCLYPNSIAELSVAILQGGGALLSEYPYLQQMKKHYFQARNRLISALGAVTVIVQASARSGTLITCRQAIEQHRPLLIVPSHPLDVEHRGGLDLLYEGATPVRDADDLIAIVKSELKMI